MAAIRGTRVLLADDHQVVRMGFRLLLEGAGATVIAEAASGEEAVRLVDDLAPDFLIMEVSMPGVGGLASLERLRAAGNKTKVLMLSAHHDEVVPLRALRLGANGYLSKRASPDEFLRAATAVAVGDRYIDPELAQQVALAQFSGASNPVDSLTEKEFAVFIKLANGQSVNQVAEDFCLSPSTVGTHLYHIKQKLNVQNASEMTLIALRAGLLQE